MREICEESEEYAAIGMNLILEEKSLTWILDTGVSIGFLTSNKPKVSKGRTIYGQCERVQDKYKAFIPYDFLITTNR